MNNIINNMLIAMSLGDHNGFPYEMMKPKLVQKISPEIKPVIIKGSFFKDSMITDDTEHLILTYLSLKKMKQYNNQQFAQNLSNYLKEWFSTLPAGIGKTTLISCLKLCIGKKYPNSGYYSAGNGPLMRAPVIGAYFYDNEENRKNAVKISTLITHIHPLAELSSHSLADIVSLLINNKQLINDKNLLLKNINIILKNATQKSDIDSKSTESWSLFINDISGIKNMKYNECLNKFFKKGVSGFCLDTLKMLIIQLYFFNDLETIINNSIYAGGDTDSTAGICAAVFSVTQDTIEIEHNIDINALLHRIDSPFYKRFVFSIIGWGKSIFILWHYIYFFK